MHIYGHDAAKPTTIITTKPVYNEMNHHNLIASRRSNHLEQY